MTEKDLMDLSFEKVMVLNEESDNGYDYHYFRKKIIGDFEIQADVIEGKLVAFSNEPSFIIWDLKNLKDLINVFRKICKDKR